MMVHGVSHDVLATAHGPMAFAGTVNSIRQRLEFLQGTFVWLNGTYLVDWVVATSFWLLSSIPENWPVYEREFSLDDPLISHPHRSQQISGTTNGLIALWFPIAVIGISSVLKKSSIDIHHGALGVWSSRGLLRLVIEFIKNRVGRLRPDFLARCKYSAERQACTGKADKVIDGRQSFPSGHTSAAFAGATFLTLYLAYVTASLCFSAPSPVSSSRIGFILRSKLVGLALTLAPMGWALWVGISRIEDYRHHKEDVIVGALIGMMTSIICYLIYFPNPFSTTTYTEERGPRMVYGGYENRSSSARAHNGYGYELTGMQDGGEHV